MGHPVKKRLLLLVLTLFIWQAAVSAEEPEAEVEQPVSAQTAAALKPYLLGASFGYMFSGYREETDSPLNRALNTFTFALNVNAEKGGFLHSFNIGFFSGKNEALEAYPLDRSELEPAWMDQFFEYYRMEDTYTRIYLEYALDYRLWGTDAFPGSLGGALRLDSYIIEKLNNFQYMNTTVIASLGLHATQKWIINAENVLVFAAGFPLFGYALRPNYIGAFAWPLETDFVSVHNYWAVFGDLKYVHRINSLLSVYSDIGFELSLVNFPKPRRDAILRIAAGIAFAF
jgi:hypothetical protein